MAWRSLMPAVRRFDAATGLADADLRAVERALTAMSHQVSCEESRLLLDFANCITEICRERYFATAPELDSCKEHTYAQR